MSVPVFSASSNSILSAMVGVHGRVAIAIQPRGETEAEGRRPPASSDGHPRSGLPSIEVVINSLAADRAIVRAALEHEHDFLPEVKSMSGSRKGNPETILVVDDDEAVRALVVSILKRARFNVISADSGPNAISLSEKTDGKIDLLLTDWDMPEMSGIALGQALKVSRPDIHVMQMSGGAHESMMVMNYGWAFLQKPFVGVKLIEMVTAVLHSPDRSQRGGESFDSRAGTNPNSPQARDPDIDPTEGNEPKDRGE